MPEDKDRMLNDIRREESTRGRRQPVRTLSIERERMVRRVGELLADANCDRDTFIETIHEYGLTSESPEYPKLLSLWRRRHGNA